MGIQSFSNGFQIIDYHTETAATTIDEEIQGVDGSRVALTSFDFLCGANAQDISIMHPGTLAGCRTTVLAGSAAAQKDIICVAAPTDPAGNVAEAGDIIAYQVTGGAWEFNTVASLSSFTITLTNNIAVAIPANGKIRIFGIIADGAIQKIHCLANVVTKGADAIYAANPEFDDPLYVSIDNGTSAGFLNNMLFTYINK